MAYVMRILVRRHADFQNDSIGDKSKWPTPTDFDGWTASQHIFYLSNASSFSALAPAEYFNCGHSFIRTANNVKSIQRAQTVRLHLWRVNNHQRRRAHQSGNANEWISDDMELQTDIRDTCESATQQHMFETWMAFEKCMEMARPIPTWISPTPIVGPTWHRPFLYKV